MRTDRSPLGGLSLRKIGTRLENLATINNNSHVEAVVAKKSGGTGEFPGAKGDIVTEVHDFMNDFFKTILESDNVPDEEKRDLGLVANLQAREEAQIEEARRVASQQARRTYRCEGCGLEFLGILAFAEHDEESSHMSNRGKKVVITGHL